MLLKNKKNVIIKPSIFQDDTLFWYFIHYDFQYEIYKCNDYKISCSNFILNISSFSRRYSSNDYEYMGLICLN